MDRLTMLIRSQWDRLLAAAAAMVGVVVLIIGWVGVSGAAYPAEQLPYVVSGGIGGLFLLGVASALWLSADLHDEWRKLDRIEQALRAKALDTGPDVAPGLDASGSQLEPARRPRVVAAASAR